MKILVLGSGLIGPAAAHNSMLDPAVSQVTLCDMNQQQLGAAQAKLESMEGGEKLSAVMLDLNDQEAASRLMADYDATVAALPKVAIFLGIRAALTTGTPLVDLGWPPRTKVAHIKQQAEATGTLIIPGCVEISFGRFFQVGDRVELGGIVGDVVDIGVLRTTLFELGQWIGGDQHNGRIVRVANSLVFKDPVFNYSADFPFLWDEVTVPVKYGSDRRLAREILQQVIDEIAGPDVPAAQTMRDRLVKKYMIEQLVVEPVVTMTANDNWIEYTIRYVVDYRKRRRTKDQIYERILDEFDRSEGRVSIASTTVQLVDPPPFDIRLGERTKELKPAE